MNWPLAPTDVPIGDGLYAGARECPSSLENLCQLVRDHRAAGSAIYPQGGATALDYGGVPARPGVVIDVRGLDQVIDYPAGDMTITVEAGMTVQRLTALLAAEKQRLPLDIPFADRATLGGAFATAVSGPRRFGWGRPRDQILGIQFVKADGQVVNGGGRVVKNVAGYDFPKLLTGSLGSLGILTQMTLRVRPIPESSAVAFASCPTLEDAAEALERLNLSETRPVALELLNPSAVGWYQSRGLPLISGAWTVVVGLEDNQAAVSWQVEKLREELGSLGAKLEVLSDGHADPAWDALMHFAVQPPGRLTLKVSVRPSEVPNLFGELDSGLWALQAHAGNGIVWCHWIGPSEGNSLADLLPEVDRVRSLAIRGGGTLMIPHCPTPWKERLRVWGEPRSEWPLMARIKETLDPEGVMNPGRFLGTIH